MGGDATRKCTSVAPAWRISCTSARLVVPRTIESSTTTTFFPARTSRTGLNLIFTLAVRPACAGWMNVRPT